MEYGEQTPGSNGESCWDFVWASSRICLHADHSLFFFDKNTYPLRALVPENNVRIVPEDRAFATAPSWRPTLSACHRCTSMSGRTWTKAR